LETIRNSLSIAVESAIILHQVLAFISI